MVLEPIKSRNHFVVNFKCWHSIANGFIGLRNYRKNRFVQMLQRIKLLTGKLLQMSIYY